MKIFSLRTVIDDIMLIVRNNNISESEDLSRSLIAAWVLSYVAQLSKKLTESDKLVNADEDSSLSDFKYTYGPIELKVKESLDSTDLFTKVTIEKIPRLLNNDEYNLISVFDQEDCPIQIMHGIRNHFHTFRKYTGEDLVATYRNGYIEVRGFTERTADFNYIWITGIFGQDITDDMDEDDIPVPGWMIPDIKKMIMDNELKFMLAMPSDDDNNSALDGIKPAGPQSNEK